MSRVVNPAGVEDASQVTIDFDPQLDHLILHAVTVRRGTQIIDELRRGRIQVLRRESELDQDILDGSLTFHLIMSDVRVGDIIDLSYTIRHQDATLGNRFFDRVTTGWGDPVAHSRLRVLIPESAPLSIAGTEPAAPIEHRAHGWRTLEWNWQAVPAVTADEDAPSWYAQYPAIQFSQFTTWEEVVRTSLPLFSYDPHDPTLATVAKRLMIGARTGSERGLAAVRFVQEDIRYTGLELGSGAFRARPPGVVLRSRYGDCKDKALLAVALLRAMGIEAAPALVSTSWEGHLSDQLPSPGDFDHAVVRIRLAGKTYWVDATETGQGGDLQTLDQAHFGKALVIAPGVVALETMPRAVATRPLVSANSVFDLRSGMDAEGSYEVSTVYRGSEADSLRRRLRRTTAAQLGERYLNYYKTRYLEIRALTPPVIHDDPLANAITVNEAYRIAHPFEPRQYGKQRFEMDMEVIDDYAPSTHQPARTAPLALDYPVNVSEQVTIRLPSHFPIKAEVVKIDNAVFRYESDLTHSGNDVVFRARYRTLGDEVSRDQLDAFLAKLDAVRQDDSLEFTSNGQESGTTDPASAGVSAKRALSASAGQTSGMDTAIAVPPLITVLLSLLFGIWCAWRAYRYDPAPAVAEEDAPRGIGGFLLLPAFGVAIGPLAFLITLLEFLRLSVARLWETLPWIGTPSYQAWHAYAYLALLSIICVQFVGSLVNFALFFRKRSSAPAVVVALMWLCWLATLGLRLFDTALRLKNHTFLGAAFLAGEQAFFMIVWSVYMFRSQRVKATFVARRPVPVSRATAA